MKRILITGANGLLGKELVQQLKDEHLLYLLVRDRNQDVIHPNVKYCMVNLEENNSLDALPQACDVIFHLAQSADFRLFPEKSKSIFQVNTLSTLNLLEYGRNAGCSNFIYASSGAVYLNDGRDNVSEDNTLSTQSDNFYAVTKLTSELLIHPYKKFFNTVIGRFFFIYGKNQKRSMLIPRLHHSIIDHHDIVLEGDEGIVINPIYVSDAAYALKNLMELKQNLIVNIAGPQILSLLDIIKVMENALFMKAMLKKLPVTGSGRLVANIDKLKSLGINPQIDFATGFSKYLNS